MVAFLALSVVRPALADDEVERVRQVLHDHPEILVDALRKDGRAVLEILENAARDRQRELERARFAAALDKPLVPDLKAARASRGPADAPVTIVEYSDFLCHFCKQAAGTVKELLAKHPKDVRLVYKHFATGKNDVRAALYFEAISLQDPAKAWAFMDAAFDGQKDVAEKGDEALAAMGSPDRAGTQPDGRGWERCDRDAGGRALLETAYEPAGPPEYPRGRHRRKREHRTP